jgi:hypothetical protein
MGAALTGFVAGTNAIAQDAPKGDQDKDKTTDSGKKAGNAKLPKHACKGLNACKGQGGGPDAGKNSCKGQGSCRTDGKKPE